MDLLKNMPVEFVPFIQIAVALFFGMVLGIERVLAGRTAGPRTYGLVAIGACLATILSVSAIESYRGTNADPIHIIAAIITGVGFIGAGLIVFRDSKLSGLTTAAGIWVAAIIGITVGYKMYLLAFFTTFLTLFVFTVMWRFERVIKNRFKDHFANTQQEHDQDNE
jgi:putative Mg2+ transporter-C (MgtC) family protein